MCLVQGFEGTLVWEDLDSAGLSVNSSSVQLSDGGGVLKISPVRTDTESGMKLSQIEFVKLRSCAVLLQIAEGILPHRSALGFPGLAGGFTFTIYGWFGLILRKAFDWNRSAGCLLEQSSQSRHKSEKKKKSQPV